MKLRSYLLSDENIYLAIYAVRSYVFDPKLLDSDDKKLLNDLMDPFDEETIFEVITDVKGIIKHILDEEDYLFKTQVYFKPKEYQNGECIYRPIHTAKLDQLIAMVAIMHPLIYEIATRDEEWKLNLSNYSRLIPKNFTAIGYQKNQRICLKNGIISIRNLPRKQMSISRHFMKLWNISMN